MGVNVSSIAVDSLRTQRGATPSTPAPRVHDRCPHSHKGSLVVTRRMMLGDLGTCPTHCSVNERLVVVFVESVALLCVCTLKGPESMNATLSEACTQINHVGNGSSACGERRCTAVI